MLYYGFILPDGTELIPNDTVRTHEQLAEKYIKENYLYKDFRKSSCEDPVDFLVVDLGAIKVGNFAKATSITVAIPYYSDFVRDMANQYASKGYRIDRFQRRY